MHWGFTGGTEELWVRDVSSVWGWWLSWSFCEMDLGTEIQRDKDRIRGSDKESRDRN